MLKKWFAVLLTLLLAQAAREPHCEPQPEPSHPMQTVPILATGGAVSGSQRPSALSAAGFNPALDMLPASYRGEDVEALYRLLVASAPGPKSEFETTAEFSERIKKFLDNPIHGSLRPGGLFAFVLGRSGYQSPLQVLTGFTER
jgi:hypothetical protein